jgi:hypothetical protein
MSSKSFSLVLNSSVPASVILSAMRPSLGKSRLLAGRIPSSGTLSDCE